ncbi:MAG: hypothetical protein ACI9WC_000059 [Arenicella sp.]|jgi:hypothetical protein
MTLHRYLNIALPIAFGVFFTANVALANHHEENETGNIDPEQIEQYKAMHKDMHKDKRGKMRDRKGQHSVMRMHGQLDTNEDGKVDLDEFLSHAKSRFNEMDTDSDQFVTDEEAKLHHKNMRQKHEDMRKHHQQKRGERADQEAGK